MYYIQIINFDIYDMQGNFKKWLGVMAWVWRFFFMTLWDHWLSPFFCLPHMLNQEISRTSLSTAHIQDYLSLASNHHENRGQMISRTGITETSEPHHSISFSCLSISIPNVAIPKLFLSLILVASHLLLLLCYFLFCASFKWCNMRRETSSSI